MDLGFAFDVVAAVIGHEVGTKEVLTPLIHHYVGGDLVERKRGALEAWDLRLRKVICFENPLEIGLFQSGLNAASRSARAVLKDLLALAPA